MILNFLSLCHTLVVILTIDKLPWIFNVTKYPTTMSNDPKLNTHDLINIMRRFVAAFPSPLLSFSLSLCFSLVV